MISDRQPQCHISETLKSKHVLYKCQFWEGLNWIKFSIFFLSPCFLFAEVVTKLLHSLSQHCQSAMKETANEKKVCKGRVRLKHVSDTEMALLSCSYFWRGRGPACTQCPVEFCQTLKTGRETSVKPLWYWNSLRCQLKLENQLILVVDLLILI